jgi:IS5 family transposase
LVDCIRVLTRLLRGARGYIVFAFTNHHRRAKRRALAIQHSAKAEDRVPLYRDLVKVAENTVEAAQSSVDKLVATYPPEAFETPELHDLRAALKHYPQLAHRVLDPPRRRVFDGETVPAPQKIVSIFEPHTDIIRKDRRETLYGHKVFLTAGASGLIVDCLVERGNPRDSDKAASLATRATKALGHAPEQICFDGGFSARANIGEIRSLGVRDVVFSKAPGIAIKEMIKRTWLYQRLRHFRAGIEGIISFLKRSFGWDRCAWRSYSSFRAYAWSSVIAATLVMLARYALR